MFYSVLQLAHFTRMTSAKGMYVGAPCEFTCHVKLHHVFCDPATNTCGCEKNYPVLIDRRKGCAKRKYTIAFSHLWRHHLKNKSNINEFTKLKWILHECAHIHTSILHKHAWNTQNWCNLSQNVTQLQLPIRTQICHK